MYSIPKRKIHIIAGIFVTFLLLACQPSKAPLEAASSDTYFPISINGQQLQLQLALNSEEQQKGLMHRDELAKDHGMLFLFESPDRRSFWMRNTRIPLDIGYFDASGRLLEVYRLYPYDESAVLSVSREVLIAVETNRGWYADHEIKPGAQIDMNALQKALERRGHQNSALNIANDR